MERAQTILKLQVRETFTCTILRESAADFFFTPGPQHMQILVRDFLGLQSLGLLSFMTNFALVILMMLNRSRAAILGRSFEISESIGF